MDPVTLATAAVSIVTPYLLDFGKNVAQKSSPKGASPSGPGSRAGSQPRPARRPSPTSKRDRTTGERPGVAGGGDESAQGPRRGHGPRGPAESTGRRPVDSDRERRRRPQQGRAGERRKLGRGRLTRPALFSPSSRVSSQNSCHRRRANNMKRRMGSTIRQVCRSVRSGACERRNGRNPPGFPDLFSCNFSVSTLFGVTTRLSRIFRASYDRYDHFAFLKNPGSKHPVHPSARGKRTYKMLNYKAFTPNFANAEQLTTSQ